MLRKSLVPLAAISENKVRMVEVKLQNLVYDFAYANRWSFPSRFLLNEHVVRLMIKTQ